MDFILSTRFLAGFAAALILGVVLHNVKSFPYRVSATNGG